MKAHYSAFARYNAWANRRLYAAAAELNDEEYRADRGAFFKSMHGTLNHLLTADWVWMHRFTGQGPSPERLDMIHHEQLADLRRAREAEDKRIVDYIDGLTEAEARRHDPLSPRLDARGVRAGARARPGALLQPPGPSPRPGALDPVQLRQARAGARSALLPARGRGGKSVRKTGSGGRSRARTYDPLIKSQLLYQLSYAPPRNGALPEEARV